METPKGNRSQKGDGGLAPSEPEKTQGVTHERKGQPGRNDHHEARMLDTACGLLVS